MQLVIFFQIYLRSYCSQDVSLPETVSSRDTLSSAGAANDTPEIKQKDTVIINQKRTAEAEGEVRPCKTSDFILLFVSRRYLCCGSRF